MVEWLSKIYPVALMHRNKGGTFMKKSIIFALISMLLCTALFVGCGSDEPTAEEKKADMDKAFLAFAAQITRFQELSTKVGATSDSLINKKITASQAKEQFESIATTFSDVGANTQKIETPKWLSSENKAKFEEMKKLYTEAADTMSSYAKTLVKCSDTGKCSTEDSKKITEYSTIRKDRLVKGAELMTYFADGKWQK